MPLCWFATGMVGLNLPVTIELPWLSVLSFMILGVLVAVNPKLPPAAVALMAGLYGSLHGLLNGTAIGVSGAGSLSLFGIAVTVLIISLLLSASIVSLHFGWTHIAVRVAGSWVAAVGMLMFGWLMKGNE